MQNTDEIVDTSSSQAKHRRHHIQIWKSNKSQCVALERSPQAAAMITVIWLYHLRLRLCQRTYCADLVECINHPTGLQTMYLYKSYNIIVHVYTVVIISFHANRNCMCVCKKEKKKRKKNNKQGASLAIVLSCLVLSSFIRREMSRVVEYLYHVIYGCCIDHVLMCAVLVCIVQSLLPYSYPRCLARRARYKSLLEILCLVQAIILHKPLSECFELWYNHEGGSTVPCFNLNYSVFFNCA